MSGQQTSQLYKWGSFFGLLGAIGMRIFSIAHIPGWLNPEYLYHPEVTIHFISGAVAWLLADSLHEGSAIPPTQTQQEPANE